jgi:hypothetical protein
MAGDAISCNPLWTRIKGEIAKEQRISAALRLLTKYLTKLSF